MDSERNPARTLTLEIDSERQPISGRLREGASLPHEFVGWLGLAKALELALDAGSPSTPRG